MTQGDKMQPSTRARPAAAQRLTRNPSGVAKPYSATEDGALTTITSLSAAEIARKIRARELSAYEVVDAHIRRIEEVNSRLNAVVIPRFEQARKEAEAAPMLRNAGATLSARCMGYRSRSKSSTWSKARPPLSACLI